MLAICRESARETDEKRASDSGDARFKYPITGTADCCPRAASGHAAATLPNATSNSRRPMVTVIRPSRARCVKGTIPRHERAVFTFKMGRIAGCFHLCRNVRGQTKLRIALEGRVFVSGTTALAPIGMGHAGVVCERDRGSRV